MRKITVVIAMFFSALFFNTTPAHGQLAVISEEAMSIAKKYEVIVKVRIKDYSWPCQGVIFQTDYVFTNSHCLRLVRNGPPLSKDALKYLQIKINNKKAEIVNDFGATSTASASDLVLLRVKTGYFKRVPWKTDFQLDDTVFSYGKSGLAVGKITFISATRTFVSADLKTKLGDSGSAVWSHDGQFIGLRSGYYFPDPAPEKDLTDIKSTTVRIQNLLTSFNLEQEFLQN